MSQSVDGAAGAGEDCYIHLVKLLEVSVVDVLEYQCWGPAHRVLQQEGCQDVEGILGPILNPATRKEQ